MAMMSTFSCCAVASCERAIAASITAARIVVNSLFIVSSMVSFIIGIGQSYPLLYETLSRNVILEKRLGFLQFGYP